MHLSRSRCKLTRFYTLGGEVIKSVDSAKYLGVTISNNYGNRSSPWKAHVTQLAAKAHQRLGFVRRSLRGVSYSHREMAYLSLVRSLMDYAGAVWDPVETIEADKLEQVQRHAARWATGSWGVVSVTALLGELGWEDLAGRRGNQRLTLFYKILDGDTRYFDFTPDTLDLHIHLTRSRKTHSKNLKKLSGKDRNSPLSAYGKGLSQEPYLNGTA